MSYPSAMDVARGDARGHRSFYRFGITTIGTTFSPVVSGGVVQMPPPSGAQTLRVVSTSNDDSAAGIGARSVLISGLDAIGDEVSEVVELSGTTPTAFTSTSFWRVHGAVVAASGTYSETGEGSYSGEITVEDPDGRQWAFISQGGELPSPGAWQSSFYTIPRGYTALAFDQAFSPDANKPIFLLAKLRLNAHDETNPSPWIEVNRFEALGQPFFRPLTYPFGPISEFTEVGWWAKTSQGTGSAEVGIGIHLYKGASA